MPDQSHPRSIATVYGYPRQGAERELKKLTESYWSGRIDADRLLGATRDLRLERIREMAALGIEEVPSNDFSLYDHVLDTAFMLGAIPERHRSIPSDVHSPSGRLDRYFAMARGSDAVEPLEMTKWFGTNYHYLVPELDRETTFVLDASKPVSEFRDAQEIGVTTRPVILGPLSFLLLSKPTPGGVDFRPLELLDRLLPRYVELLGELHGIGVEWVQFDEPALVVDQPAEVLAEVERAYAILGATQSRPKILVASYFDRLGEALPVLAQAPVEGLAMDFVGPGFANLEEIRALGGLKDKRLVAGIVDGHNVWVTDLTRALDTLETLRGLAEEVDASASCSLLHVPLDVTLETAIDPQIAAWLAFARQKLEEIAVLARGLSDGREAIASELELNRSRITSRAHSSIVTVDAVRARSAEVSEADLRRLDTYEIRREQQGKRLNLPLLATTTIGSFPQTKRLREARADLGAGRLELEEYEQTMRDEIRDVVALQEALGLDVLVHGEPERNDMVQYFAEQLDGFLTTRHGWVQSYGSRYVRPPIIFGDVSRPKPITVRWATYAQSLTERPVKGMLTGPLTMLAWSFVRDDQPRSETARQVALALRDEVTDLEAAGVAVIQVDEPGLRETLPLRQEDRSEYLRWAVEAFRLATSAVRNDTSIHTHMCYAEFGDVFDSIIEMDADVISLEAARSQMAIVGDLALSSYPNEVGPGVWDIHSPRVPSTEEIAERLRSAIASFPPARLWVNPDCGLKTRGYAEVDASLTNLVAAARLVRSEL